ncbi:MAG: Do family serine endopeptidase [Rhizobiaceae bacterium]
MGAGLSVSTPVSAQSAPAGPESVADLAEKLLPAVVNISTSQNVGGPESGTVPMPKLPEGSPFQDFFDQFFDEQQQGEGGEGNGGGGNSRKVQSLGSGFVIDAKDGIIVTNNHVIADADDIEINFADGKKLKATLVGKDAKTDLAVLKVDASKHQLTAVPFGNSDDARIGDWVMAIGNPFGLGGSVTVGIISARNRDIQSGPYDRFIQTDAAINRGNSGGPLFNMNGEVIGINSAIISPSGGSIGLGFSIPSELASSVVEQLRQFGETRRGWLGVRIQPVTDDIAESLGMPNSEGALIAGIIKGSPVDDGTIVAGDVVKKFDGREIKEVRDLSRMVAESAVGKKVEIVIIRKGKEQTVNVTLGRLEDGEKQLADNGDKGTGEPGDKPVETKVLGMTLGELTTDSRKANGIADDIKGVLITKVEPNSAAAEKQVLAGEVITEVAQETVTSAKEFADKIDKLKKEGRKNALLMVASKTGELRFLTLRIE